MDPLTAWAIAAAEGFKMVTEIVKGQPPEAKARIWDQWITFIDRALAAGATFEDLFKPAAK